MASKTDLTLHLQGDAEKDGKITVIDYTEEHINTIMGFTFEDRDDGKRAIGVTAVGAFSTEHYAEIIRHMIKIIGREQYMKAFMLAELADELTTVDEIVEED